MIEVEHLTKRYDRTTAISDVTFSVGAGEVLGFLGPNGAGKTTTMRAITGYLPATEGRITVGGYDVFEKPLEVRRQIGYLPENPPLYPEMTVSGYLRFVGKIKGVPRAELENEVVRVMEKVNVRDVEGRIVGRLSKGYRQRVGLAQALLNDPPVLILDEPTIGLDPKQIHEVRELIKEWRGEHTVILSTHILPEVEQTCTQVVIINGGKIVAVDTPANLVHALKGGDRTIVEVAGPIDDILSRLRVIPGVATATQLEGTDGRHQVQVEAGADGDLAPALARTIVEGGWSLYGLTSSTMSLEDVFLELTTDDQEEASGPKAVEPENEATDETESSDA